MNRIAIIGNGFDIAHGLKTKYQHFLGYIKEEYVKFIKKELDSSCITEHKFFTLRPQKSSRSTGSPLRYLCQPRLELKVWDDIERMISIETKIIREGIAYKSDHKSTIDFKNPILESSFEKCSELTWGGIENDYKEALVNILTTKSPTAANNYVVALNSNLQDIVDELVSYLGSLSIPTAFNEEIAKNLYTMPLYEWRGKDIDVQRLGLPRFKKKDDFDEQLNNILFLNFNYTSTIDNYLINGSNQGLVLKQLMANKWISDDIHTSARYIHGDLKSLSTNPIIFGYGDEQDEHQIILEKMSNEFFKHIKSVQYTRTPFYREMIDFADTEKFDIIIYGHSCSNTDRTLLNTLFEHENCLSIQPYLHDPSDNSIYNNIYRCFKDKKNMRSRVLDQTNTITRFDRNPESL